METSSGEELLIKARKPYTITKQRERWTEEEHNRFLEALKLHGRAWQRIEEHIGTKTAVQIRSHAQKFFSKLEKEAHTKGVPVGHELEIDIPPPRPKRKPSNPYPRKTGIGAPVSQIGVKDDKVPSLVPSSHCKQALDLEKEPLPESPNGDDNLSNSKENNDDSFSQVFNLLEEANCSSVSNVDKNSTPSTVRLKNSCSFREFIPSSKSNQEETNESSITLELKGKPKSDLCGVKLDNWSTQASSLDIACPSHSKTIQCVEKGCLQREDDLQGATPVLAPVLVNIVDGSTGTCIQSSPPDSKFHPLEDIHGFSNTFSNPDSSTTTVHKSSSSHQSFPFFHPPFTSMPHDQDDYRSFLQISTFSSLICSTLLQNPAAHAAASFAASYWPYTNGQVSADPTPPMSSASNMTALAAATVAAATAWWAAHGLLPFCAPVHPAFTCSPPSTTEVPSTSTGHTATVERENKENTLQNGEMVPEYSELLQVQHSASSEKISSEPKVVENEKAAADVHDLNSKKLVDRSSCGSNTASSSDVETDALEKNEQEKEEVDANNLIESNNRRSRSNSSYVSESWKEVSEEGRLAFRALFSKGRLPQSFSPPPGFENTHNQENRQNTDVSSVLDLNTNTWIFSSNPQMLEKISTIASTENNGHDGLLTLGHGQCIFKARQTGFKPYKRCSVEARAKEHMIASINGGQGEEQCPKRIRLEKESST